MSFFVFYGIINVITVIFNVILGGKFEKTKSCSNPWYEFNIANWMYFRKKLHF